LPYFSQNGDNTLFRFGIIAANQPIVFAFTDKSRIQIVLCKPLVGAVATQNDPVLGMTPDIVDNDFAGIIS
jgi:hypothetical protein